MAKLDLDWLSVFVEVYKTQSVSRAALALGIEQASASIALTKLRRAFDDPLFSRTSMGMEPTPKARDIYPELQSALSSIEKARGDARPFVPDAARRVFRLCMTDISEIVLLPQLVNHLQINAPHVTVEIDKIAPDSRRRLESGDADLAVGFAPDLDAGFYQQALFAQDYVCLAMQGHPRIHGKLTRTAFAREGHIDVTSPGTGHAAVDKTLARLGMDRRVVLQVPSFLGVAAVVAQTELLVVVPRQLGQLMTQHHQVQMLEPPVPMPGYKVKQHWHQRFNADTGNVWMRRTLMKLFANKG
jgi:DNA-binding transcriptional LysR family regulator